MRPAAERPTHYQVTQRHGTPLYTTREQGLPAVVRGSPITHGLQDMLVPSIETASSDAVIDSPHPDRRHEVYEAPQESYPRRVVERVVERRRQSPAPHQVIVINDDSPQLKRRRVVYEDGLGHFRPLPPRDRDAYSTAPRADSYLLPASSVQRDFLVRHERPPQSSQGLFRDGQPSLAGPVVGERIPIYDTPLDSNYFAPTSDRYKRLEAGYVPIQRDGPPIKRYADSPQPYLDAGDRPYTRRPVNGNVRVVENDGASPAQPEFSSRIFENAGESSYARRPVSGDMRTVENDRVNQAQPEISSRVPQRDGYQVLLDNLSQSRLDPTPLPRARDGFAAPSYSTTQVNTESRYENQPSEVFTKLRPEEARSPVRYVERPM